MTLPARLTREALPCLCSGGRDQRHAQFCAAQHRPAVEAAIRKAVEACADIADDHNYSASAERVRKGIRALLTDKETP